MTVHMHTFNGSSMLASCVYDTDNEELVVTFTNGKDYTYSDVSRDIYDSLIGAKSAGQYFNSIKKELVQK